jgi:hypothetical protein
VVTETGAGCTPGACSPVQNTAFPGRACSRKTPQYVKKNAKKKLIGSSQKKIPGTDVNEPRRQLIRKLKNLREKIQRADKKRKLEAGGAHRQAPAELEEDQAPAEAAG